MAGILDEFDPLPTYFLPPEARAPREVACLQCGTPFTRKEGSTELCSAKCVRARKNVLQNEKRKRQRAAKQ